MPGAAAAFVRHDKNTGFDAVKAVALPCPGWLDCTMHACIYGLACTYGWSTPIDHVATQLPSTPAQIDEHGASTCLLGNGKGTYSMQ